MQIWGSALVLCGLVGAAGAQTPAASRTVQDIVAQRGSLTPVQAYQCTGAHVQDIEKKILAEMNLGQFVDARANGTLEAQWLAACELHPELWQTGRGENAAKGNSANGLGMSTSNFEQHIGRGLALEYLAGVAAAATTPEDERARQDALVLFSAVGDGEGGALAKRLTAEEDKKAADRAQPVTASLSALAAVTAYADNRVAFNAKYSGKRMQVEGVVRTIAATGKTALIVLRGITNKDPDRVRLMDSLNCDVEDQAEVIPLNKEMKVRVSGIYDTQATMALGSLTLTQCTVVPVR